MSSCLLYIWRGFSPARDYYGFSPARDYYVAPVSNIYGFCLYFVKESLHMVLISTEKQYIMPGWSSSVFPSYKVNVSHISPLMASSHFQFLNASSAGQDLPRSLQHTSLVKSACMVVWCSVGSFCLKIII